MLIKSNERVFICGKTRTGKTYFAKSLIKNFKKYIIYDPDHEYSELGFVVKNFKDFKQALIKNSKVIYQPKSYGQEEFIEVCRFIFTRLKNVMFVADEIADLAPNNSIPQEYALIIRRGGKRGIGSIAITQRIAECHKTPIAQAEHIISFYQFLDNDVKRLKDHIGEEAEKTRELKPKYFLYFNGNEIFMKNPIK